jgi:adenylate cyclase
VKRCDIKTVLIVEDDADIRKFASRVLELEGYRIIQAADADEGLRLARKRRVALVLLDLRLPGRDGWVVLAELKSEPALSAIPVIVFTASAGAPQRDRALSMGAVDYLVKPLSAASLKQSVAHILHR